MSDVVEVISQIQVHIELKVINLANSGWLLQNVTKWAVHH